MKVVAREVLANQRNKVEDAAVKDVWSRLSHAAKEIWVKNDGYLGAKMGSNDYTVMQVKGQEFIGELEFYIEEADTCGAEYIRVLNHEEAVEMKKLV